MIFTRNLIGQTFALKSIINIDCTRRCNAPFVRSYYHLCVFTSVSLSVKEIHYCWCIQVMHDTSSFCTESGAHYFTSLHAFLFLFCNNSLALGHMNKLSKLNIWCEFPSGSTDQEPFSSSFRTKDQSYVGSRSISLHLDKCSKYFLNSLKAPCYRNSPIMTLRTYPKRSGVLQASMPIFGIAVSNFPYNRWRGFALPCYTSPAL